VADRFVINIGDLMQRWTNDTWRSTLHRVVVPPGAGGGRRMSLAFFHQPDWAADIVNLTDAAPR
jgi:isopenicillin N synthase-like dioxygenase